MSELIGLAGAGIAVALALLFVRSGFLERRFSYAPAREVEYSPSDVGLAYEEVWMDSADGVALHGWFVPGKRDVTFLWLHGNGGNIAYHLEHLRDLRANLGVNVLLFDYRGFGRSSGIPAEKGLYRDAAAALRYLKGRPGVQPDRIVYFGQSLGTALAVELATHEAPLGLVLEAPFPSGPYMAHRMLPFLPMWFHRYLVPNRFDTAARIGRVKAPLLIVHGELDMTVPHEAGRVVLEAANEPKEMLSVPHANHVDAHAVGGSAYYAALLRFVEGL